MMLTSGRSLAWAVAYLVLLTSLTLTRAGTAHAQNWDDEVIEDPEAGDSFASDEGEDEVIYDPEAGDAPASGGDDSDMVFEDPEAGDTGGGGRFDNHGWGDAYVPPTRVKDEEQYEEEEEEVDPMANTGVAKLELGAQFGYDIFHEGDLEDAYETRLRLGGEIEFRRSRNLRLVLGTRLDMLWALPSQTDPTLNDQRALDEDRFELDILATAAYADATVAPGVHLRIGQQTIIMGRMDFASQTDMLAVYDMRPNPKLDASGGRLAQPAVRLDWDISSAVTLQLAYVPWFQPHLMRPNRDKFIANALTGQGGADVPDRTGDVIDPSFQTKSAESSVRFVGPAPDFRTPQAAGRLSLRTRALELALIGGAAIEKIPSFYMVPKAEEFLRLNPDDEATAGRSDELEQDLGILARDQRPIFDAEYHRYFLVGVDAGWAIGPVSFGMELAYSPERHPYAVTTDGSRLAAPNTTVPITGYNASSDVSNVTDEGIRQGVPMVMGGLHVDYMRGESFLIAAEGFWVNALELPHDQTRQWLAMTEDTAFYAGGVVAASYFLNEGKYRFDLVASVANGPTFAVSPHFELKAADGLYFDIGALFITGSAPRFEMDGNQVKPDAAATNIQAGGLLEGSDQVFVGVRWMP